MQCAVRARWVLQWWLRLHEERVLSKSFKIFLCLGVAVRLNLMVVLIISFFAPLRCISFFALILVLSIHCQMARDDGLMDPSAGLMTNGPPSKGRVWTSQHQSMAGGEVPKADMALQQFETETLHSMILMENLWQPALELDPYQWYPWGESMWICDRHAGSLQE